MHRQVFAPLSKIWKESRIKREQRGGGGGMPFEA
jgi:hypothetical protein